MAQLLIIATLLLGSFMAPFASYHFAAQQAEDPGPVGALSTQRSLTNVNKDDDSISMWSNTAKDGSGTDYQPLLDSDAHLQVDILSGGGAGTEYTEADTDTTITGTAIMMEVGSDTLQPVQGSVANGLLVNLGSNNDVTATQSGTWNINNISGIVSLPTGAATSANQQTDALTDTELRASAVPVSIASLPLPSGASTSANQTTIIGHVDGIEGLLGTIDTDTGNIATNTTDLPNIIGTDGSAGPSKTLSIGGTQSTGEIEEVRVDSDGHIQTDVLSSALPTGAATAANQQTDALTDTELRATPVPVSGTITANQGTSPWVVGDGGGALTIDGSVTANAGTNLNTSALALESGGNLATIASNTDYGLTIGGGTETGALRVTIANNSTGVLSVDDNGGSLTVDATNLDIRALTNTDVVTAELSATDNAVLDTIATNTGNSAVYGDTANAAGTTSVTSTATLIFAANTDRKQAIIRNTDNLSNLFIGYNSSVTTANAPIELAPGEMWVEDHSRTAIYGITSSGTVVAARQEIET